MVSAGYERAGRITLFLAVLNLLALGFGAGLRYVEANRMPGFDELNAEKIHLWSQPRMYQPRTPVAPPLAADSTAAVRNTLCLALENISQANFQDLQTLMQANGIDSAQCTYEFDKKLAWWVFWPPEYEAARRDKALQSIHAAGVKDVLPIIQGAMAQAFSVGVFISASQARQYRDSLRSKGLDKIEYGPRPGIGYLRLGCQVDEPDRLARFETALPAWAKPVDAAQCQAGLKPRRP
ncbi:MAG: hypothetical protein GW787_04650 [Betaproteobacteria bacterium]|nr:hypothetical protein [Betaproteobacteria bacterium]